MKIVHLCLSNFYIDNYSYQENMLPKYHVLQGHEVSVIASLVSFDSDGKPCQLPAPSTTNTKDGFKVIRLDYRRPFYKFNRYVRYYDNLIPTLESENPDLIFIHDFSFMDIGKVIAYVSKHPQVRVFVDCHTDYINSARSWISKHVFHHLVWRLYAKLLSPHVEKYYGVTPLRCDFLRDAYRIDPQKIELLVMGVDDESLHTKDRAKLRAEFLHQHRLGDDDFLICTGGKIDEKKNIHLVMQAVRGIKHKNARLIVFGSVAPEMKADFEKFLGSENIQYIGWLNPEQITDLFLIADLVVFPGTHSVLWEQAVGAGTPCVFKHWDGMTHVDVGGNCAFLHRDSEEEIRTVIEGIVSSPDQYRQMKEIALARGIKKFSYSDIAREAIRDRRTPSLG